MEIHWESPLFLVTALSGTALVVAGLLLWKFPPRHINFLYGYRTRRSMRTQQAWDFSQPYAGKKLVSNGLLLALTGLLSLLIPTLHEGVGIILSIILIILFGVMTIVQTERALKDRFDG